MSGENFTLEEAKEMGESLGIEWDMFDVEQFQMGMNVELEHGTMHRVSNITNDNPEMTAKIALAHLNEIRDYYTRLEAMEKEGEAFWEGK
ncbi:MAG: DUF5661 family protein [bacterium]|nr:DUF5661 family protein [bacterium]